jgi:hypothetical protein
MNNFWQRAIRLLLFPVRKQAPPNFSSSSLECPAFSNGKAFVADGRAFVHREDTLMVCHEILRGVLEQGRIHGFRLAQMIGHTMA